MSAQGVAGQGRADTRPRINRAAMASLAAAVLWLYGIASIAAIILGLVALRQAHVRSQRGSGLAWTGVVLGELGIGLVLMLTPA